ncbi:MAG: phosphohistidine phosphatase SixA [Acidobacteriota bacterium]
MELYILRHAIAVEREEWQGSDEGRPLISAGRDKMKEIATGLRLLVPKFDAILTSPLVRAWQTAEIVCKVYGIKNSDKLHETVALSPDSRFDSLFAELRQFSNDKRVLIIGHQPYLGDLIAYLIADGFARNIPLKKGGAACLQIDPMAPRSSGLLQWLLTPKQLRMLVKPNH